MTPMPRPGTRAALYGRSATNLQTSPPVDDQLARCRAYAEQQGWRVVGVFCDAGRCGTTRASREGFAAMMVAAERGELDLILVEDLDRLSRNASDAHSIIEELERLNITVCTVAHGMLTEIEVAFHGIMATRLKRDRSANIRRSLARRRERIAFVEAVPRKPAFSASVVERIVRDHLAGVSLEDIARTLNAEVVSGPRTRRGAV